MAKALFVSMEDQGKFSKLTLAGHKSISKEILAVIPRSVEADHVINGKNSLSKLQGEHITPMKLLCDFYQKDEFERLIDAFAFAFVTKDEHDRLGRKGGAERYQSNNISLLVPDARMIKVPAEI